ncbi:recombinase family protein [Streptomyces sp. NPDC004232]|uniref:recombinase family protein n=1 Tax=Streptomyces sp. NPDC004232 TaxID=3154454 RepID=UPI001E09CA3D|nr:recombinase family protein [Streptomyces sp. tea 10]
MGIHTRIGKDDEAEGLGVARQEEDCRRHCAARGWEVAEVYEDNDLSAYKRRTVRPEFRQMPEDLKAGRIDGVVAWDIGRFSRQPRELEAWIDEYEEAERRGRRLVFDSVSASDIDLSKENGRFIARIEVTIADKSSADTSRRTQRKHLELAAQGKLPGGRAPYGWNREDRRTLAPEEAEHLRKAVKHFLDERGEPVVGDWEPIITPEEWHLLTAKVRRETARCGRCGTKMRALVMRNETVPSTSVDAVTVPSTTPGIIEGVVMPWPPRTGARRRMPGRSGAGTRRPEGGRRTG